MELILVGDVEHLGRRGDVVRVANGYGRNYLLPKGLALLSTPANLKMVKAQRLARARRQAKHKAEAELLAEELTRRHAVLSRRAGETGLLFGSVTSRDVSDLLSANGIEVDRRKILLEHPIKNIGNYRLDIRCHAEVTAQLLVSIVPEEEAPVQQLKQQDDESNRLVAELEFLVDENKAAGIETPDSDSG
jgi:large subunit ribosomal protein L9